MSARVAELDLETGVYTRQAFERELAFVETAAEQRRVLSEQLDAEGKTGGFRPVLELAARVDPAMIGWLREQIEATKRT